MAVPDRFGRLWSQRSIDVESARQLVEATFRGIPDPRFAVRLWDGTEVAWGGERRFTLGFADPEIFLRCLTSRDPARFAEAYADERLHIEGDFWDALELAQHLRRMPSSNGAASAEAKSDAGRSVGAAPGAALRLVAPASSHTPEQDRRDVQWHYDLSDDLFRLFLDSRMVYSCAYFATPGQSLERAQERKLDLICRKLDLHAGDHFLDVGCGWGALVIWAAQHYGVRAHGITLSEHQLDEARRRVAEAGLADRATIELQHYRELPEDAFDKISSIGMYEHVGIAQHPLYFRTMLRALRAGGLFLNHGINQPPLPHEVQSTGGAFIFRQVFPGAELPSVAQVVEQLQNSGFELLDVQALRPHYALTLRDWFVRLEARRAEAVALTSERSVRVLEMYLAGCAQAFRDGLVGVHQVLVGKPDRAGRVRVPLTRTETLLTDEVPTSAPRSWA